MLTLYLLQFIMLFTALGIISFAFIPMGSVVKKNFFIISLVFSSCAITLYAFTAKRTALQYWLNGGKKHYELLVQFNELGGIEGMIAKVKAKLTLQPDDNQGWMILSKLYEMNNDPVNAADALKHIQ